ncbi:hypothetical protein NE235_18360 [Actinoallomurus spadix]|uniref:Translation elongation factor EFG/EF2 domain-containing protein n=1 Tax=Actinoallomurus spadix TaxID=79912 RepID=A0ABP3FPZ5_9ACTN|nr:hypothetical protein [Actinoallomurus spadix]MCO5988069.1 hypothetical protein [Actinoallomurus spadix]
MDPEVETFPPYPIRGVRARYFHQTSCPGDFADVTVDFEPWEEGLTFEVVGSATVEDHFRRDLPGFRAALVEGIREELAERVTDVPVALAVVLRHIRVHEVDSRDASFRMAGRVAVREALDRLQGPPPRPKRRRRP